MIKKNLFVLFVIYFFVIQLYIIGLIWGETNFYILGTVNLVAIALVSFGYMLFTSDNKKEEKQQDLPIVTEKRERVVLQEQEGVVSSVVESQERRISREPISESNIEYIKTKINHVKKKPLAEGAALYRFLIFLCALLGFGGILYLFWESLDFIAIVIGALAMLLFIGVLFKSANLWRKSLFSSLYFLLFTLIAIGGIIGLCFGNNIPFVDKLKESITIFVDGMKGEGEISLEENNDDLYSGFLFEETGESLDTNLTGIVLTGDNYISGALYAGNDNLSETGVVDNQVVEQNKQESNKAANNVNNNVSNKPSNNTNNKASNSVNNNVNNNVNTKIEESNSTNNTEQSVVTEKTGNDQVTILEAIKHLIKANNIPLSQSKSTKFTYIEKTSKDYPYMKTALDKKMIGRTTDPNMIVSCDVYMVMKGLAEGWNLGKPEDIKGVYWNVAESKNELNGCKKGEKLKVANL